MKVDVYNKSGKKTSKKVDLNKKIPYLLFASLVFISCINIYFGIETTLNVDMASQIANELINK